MKKIKQKVFGYFLLGKYFLNKFKSIWRGMTAAFISAIEHQIVR